ncbi:MAG: N-acetylmuramoyl-L-alanine amidase [Oscillospiraceae bacterium]|jgi:LysM repeat protein|nr:N-acetylmuramoyl-L-alanine amidase [Oscillospiraceae bacterium]
MAENSVKLAVFAGHGGADPGAVCGKMKEKDLTLKVSNALAVRLRALGYTIIQNRTTDCDSGISEKCALANNAGVSAVCEVHINAGGGTGAEVWYADGSTRSKAFAEKLLAPIVALGFKDRGIKNDKTSRFGSFGILRGTKAPAVLVEICFIDNANDMARFDAEKSAAAITEGLYKFCPPPEQSSAKPPVTPVTVTPSAAQPFSVGDKVTITGAYAASASAVSAGHTAAVGRTEYVGKIYAGSRYPYRIDSASGVAIGFASASGIKKAVAASGTPKTGAYTVLSGDSLWAIANKLLGSGARYTEIIALNGMKNANIYPGNVLRIPAK